MTPLAESAVGYDRESYDRIKGLDRASRAIVGTSSLIAGPASGVVAVRRVGNIVSKLKKSTSELATNSKVAQNIEIPRRTSSKVVDSGIK